MKANKMTYVAKTFALGMLITLMAFMFQSCAKKVHFLTSSVVPAAEGEVTVKKDKNENYSIKLEIENLAEVSRLQPPKQHYVVWMEADRGMTRNIGMITSSNRLKVSFETVSTLKPTRIFITAEEDGSVQYPGSMVVLTTENIR
jgi:hypothetical protein